MEHAASAATGVHRRSLIALCAVSVVLGACADQPGPKCTAARGAFAATYTLISGTGECAELKGEVLNVQAYNAPMSDSDPTPDYDRTSIGIQPQSITDLLGAGASNVDEDDKPFALGAFNSAKPDADGFCVAPKLNGARLRSEEVPEQMDMCTTTPALPPVDIEYVWSNVRVYVTAAAFGTQLAAKLTYTKDGCTAKYDVRAVFPAVSCGATPEPSSDADASASAPPPAMEDDAGADQDAGAEGDAACPPVEVEAPGPAPVPDADLCAPDFGLNPDFAVRCDPELLLCVPKRAVPSLQ